MKPSTRLVPARRRVLLALGTTSLALLVPLYTLPSFAAGPVSKSRFGGVAIGGHDTIAYYELGREPRADAVEGEKGWSVEWSDATWRFADEASARKFAEDPERYVPAYNGHCANALSLGEGLVKTDGTHWQIFDGDDQLYLFYAARGRERWMDGDWRAYKVDADRAWEALTR